MRVKSASEFAYFRVVRRADLNCGTYRGSKRSLEMTLCLVCPNRFNGRKTDDRTMERHVSRIPMSRTDTQNDR